MRPVKNMPNDFRAADLNAYAEELAVQVLDRLNVYMRMHPEEHPDFASGCARIDSAETSLKSILGKDASLVYELGDAHYTRSYALAVEIYRQGVLDGGRIYHAMISGELPVKEEQNER